MRCADCPDIPNGTRKRPICCLYEGRAARLAKAEETIRELLGPAVPLPTGHRLVRSAALSGTLLGSALAGGFAPEVWNGRPRLAAPLTPKEQQTIAGRNAA